MIHKSHFGVYARIFDASKESILVIKKARGPYTGLYDLPGGSMEDGELLEEALSREILEETGCQLTSCRQLVTLSTLYDYKSPDGEPITFRHIGVIYHASIQGVPTSGADGHDSNGCLWMKRAHITEINSAPLLCKAASSLP